MLENKSTDLERTGVVVESLPNVMFRVKLDPRGERAPNGANEPQDDIILAYLAGKMRLHRIRVLVGDRVVLELEPYGGKARIIKRL